MFWQNEAYHIARKITGENQLYRDLVSHIYLLLHERNIPENELPRVFARYAYNQWNWPQSEWNKQYNPNAHMVSLEYVIPLQSEEEEETSSELQQFLEEYMQREASDDQELFIKEITRMHLYGMTFRDIRDHTGISLSIIHSAIKQFKYDLFNNHSHVHWNCTNSPDF